LTAGDLRKIPQKMAKPLKLGLTEISANFEGFGAAPKKKVVLCWRTWPGAGPY
jgi:hypothetical protein